MNKRDNFSKLVIDKLKTMHANRCSNPACRVVTSASTLDRKIKNIGVAAHICAASKGGPRYDISMTKEERKSIENAIWLCSNCSYDIDRDVHCYTVTKLKHWQKLALDKGRREIGRKLPSDEETVDTVTAALTGLPKNFIPKAISNVHTATEQSLEALHPRFTVKTSKIDDKTIFSLNSKEEVNFTLSIPFEGNESLNDQYKNYIEHGDDVDINMEGSELSGSPLLNTLLSRASGIGKVSSKKLKATQKLWLVKKCSAKFESFDDIQGIVTFGSKTFTFSGGACDEVFGFKYHQSHRVSSDKSNTAQITLSLKYDSWEGEELRNLNYLEKLSSFYSKISEGWEVFTSLEINGEQIFSSEGHDFSEKEFINENAELLRYFLACKLICKTFGYDVLFTKNSSYTPKGYNQILDIAEALEDKAMFKERSLSSPITFKAQLYNDVHDPLAFRDEKKPHNLEFPVEQREVIKLFGQTITLPKQIINIKNTGLKLVTAEPPLTADSSIEFECVPLDGFQLKISYQQ